MQINFNNFKKSHAAQVAFSFLSGAGAAEAGAVLAYLKAQPAASIFDAFQSGASLKTLLAGVAMVAFSTFVGLIQHSVVGPASPPASGAPLPVKITYTPADVPPAPPERNIMTKTLRNSFAMGRFLLAPIAFALVACTPSELASLKSVSDVTGAVCSTVVLAVDPALAPLCTTPAVLDSAYVALLGAYNASKGDAGVDGGVGAAPFVADPAAIYEYVSTHGGVPVGKASAK